MKPAKIACKFKVSGEWKFPRKFRKGIACGHRLYRRFIQVLMFDWQMYIGVFKGVYIAVCVLLLKINRCVQVLVFDFRTSREWDGFINKRTWNKRDLQKLFPAMCKLSILIVNDLLKILWMLRKYFFEKLWNGYSIYFGSLPFSRVCNLVSIWIVFFPK